MFRLQFITQGQHEALRVKLTVTDQKHPADRRKLHKQLYCTPYMIIKKAGDSHPSTWPCSSNSLWASLRDTPPWNHGWTRWTAGDTHTYRKFFLVDYSIFLWCQCWRETHRTAVTRDRWGVNCDVTLLSSETQEQPSKETSAQPRKGFDQLGGGGVVTRKCALIIKNYY